MPTKAAAIASTRVMKRLLPDQPGARKISQHYGAALVCVRHRVDDERGLRHTTVELLVQTVPLQVDLNREVSVRIRFGDESTRAAAMLHGARWDPKDRVWRMPLHVAKTLKLQRQIVRADKLSTGRHLKSVDP